MAEDIRFRVLAAVISLPVSGERERGGGGGGEGREREGGEGEGVGGREGGRKGKRGREERGKW